MVAKSTGALVSEYVTRLLIFPLTCAYTLLQKPATAKNKNKQQNTYFIIHPADFDIDNTAPLGMSLIQGLSGQLDGDLY